VTGVAVSLHRLVRHEVESNASFQRRPHETRPLATGRASIGRGQRASGHPPAPLPGLQSGGMPLLGPEEQSPRSHEHSRSRPHQERSNTRIPSAHDLPCRPKQLSPRMAGQRLFLRAVATCRDCTWLVGDTTGTRRQGRTEGAENAARRPETTSAHSPADEFEWPPLTQYEHGSPSWFHGVGRPRLTDRRSAAATFGRRPTWRDGCPCNRRDRSSCQSASAC